MKTLPLVLLSSLVSAGVAGTAIVVTKPADDAPQEAAAAPERDAEVAELRRQLADQNALLQDLRDKLEMRAPAPAERREVEGVEDVVRRVLAAELAEQLASAGKARAASAATSAELDELTPREAFDEILALRADGMNWDKLEAYWKDLREKGLDDEVLAEIEEWVALHPDDPNAHVMLGSAYIQHLQGKTGAETGEWAIKADQSFTRALELDERNWEARFSKAISLSFWPPIFGKQAEAVSQFEVLLDQQRESAPEPNHSQTYLFLGNLYQQQGKADKANEIWSEGLALFPENAELLEKQ